MLESRFTVRGINDHIRYKRWNRAEPDTRIEVWERAFGQGARGFDALGLGLLGSCILWDGCDAGLRFEELTLSDVLFRPAEDVRRLQDRLISRMIEICYRGHPFYRRLMRSEGITPEAVQSVGAFTKHFPITRKEDFLADPEAFRLQVPDDLTLEARVLREVMYTTGSTSGRPVPVYTTTSDYYAYAIEARRAADLLGLTDRDTIASLFPLSPFPMGAYLRAVATAGAIGAALFVTNTGRPSELFPVHRSTDDAIRLIQLHRPTVLWGVSSFVRRLLLRAEELHADFGNVRLCLLTGESTGEALRHEIKRRLGSLGASEVRVANRYGWTEGTTLVECEEGAGWHNLAPDQVLMETVDLQTGLPCDGEPGVFLVSHLIRTGTVLLRYAMGDVVQLDRAPCAACGRTSERIVSQPVRAIHIIKIKGMLVNVEAIKLGIEEIDGVDEYQIVIKKEADDDPFSPDEVVLRIAAAPSFRSSIEREAVTRVLSRAHLRPRVDFVERDEIFDPSAQAKPIRIVDQRPGIE